MKVHEKSEHFRKGLADKDFKKHCCFHFAKMGYYKVMCLKQLCQLCQKIYFQIHPYLFKNFLEGKRINEFLNLSKAGSINLILSIITVNEIKSRFKNQARVAIEKHNELLNDRQMSVLRNSVKEKIKLVKFSKIKIIAEAFDALLDEELLNANTTIIEYPVIDGEQIFKKYFEGTFPFNTGEKKHEFPDAIAQKEAYDNERTLNRKKSFSNLQPVKWKDLID